MSTIFALSTAPGKAGIAVFRLSGNNAPHVLKNISRRELPKPRQAVLRGFWHGSDLIDRGLVLYFPAPSSYTGEDMVELHLHGGPAVIAAMTRALSAQPGLRMAEPGEFSRRAFDHGKLDLSAIEGLADLIAAETDEQRRLSLHQAGGNLYRQCEKWRTELLRLQAQIEAYIDFPDEDLPKEILNGIYAGLDSLRQQISEQIQDNRRGEIMRQGYRVVLLGPPNAGKSSLLNYLAEREVAIVSSEPGTTRDILDVVLDLNGYAVRISDTAGLRETENKIEAEGVKRAKRAGEEAQLRLYLAEDPKNWPEVRNGSDFYLLTKRDIYTEEAAHSLADIQHFFPISTMKGLGIDALISAMAARVAEDLSQNQEMPLITRERHRLSLQETLLALDHARYAPLPELLAEDIRLAHRALGKIMGKTDIEAMLDLLFKEFCIGK